MQALLAAAALEVVLVVLLEPPEHAPFGACAQQAVLEKKHVAQVVDALPELSEHNLAGV